jgi:hypothetical protein
MNIRCLLVATISLSSFFVSCKPETEKALDESLSLVSPDGVRIANSLEDLSQFNFANPQHSAVGKLTVTKITYGYEPGAPAEENLPTGYKRTLANIHYKTSAGEKGTYWVEVVRPL